MRNHLANRRPSVTQQLEANGQSFTATIGFDQQAQPAEVFLNAGKEGSLINALLADAAVVISVALQHGVPAKALARSAGRVPAEPVQPANLDQHQAQAPASPVGGALDLLQSSLKELN